MMIRIICFIGLCLFSKLSFAQEPRLFIGVGTTGTSRMGYDLTNFTASEAKELRSLEIITPSYHMNLGYIWMCSDNISVKLGIEYRRTRFGSRIYTIPEHIHNVTPQYKRLKQVVYQKQTAIFAEPTFLKIKPLWSNSLFLKLGIIYNQTNYEFRELSYTETNERGFDGRYMSTGFVPHTFDVSLGIGLNYQLMRLGNNYIYLQPALSIFTRPYLTDGNYAYLYFQKDIKGYLWEFGVTTRYEFGRWGKK